MTLFLTVGVRDTNHRDEFHITTFFRVRFAKGVSLLSTSEFLLLGDGALAPARSGEALFVRRS